MSKKENTKKSEKKAAKQADNLAVSAFLGSMAALIDSGVTGEDALFSLAADGGNLAKAVSEVYDFSFAKAVRDSGIFPEYACNMVDVGATTGRMAEVLYGLSDYYERQARIEDNFAQTIIFPSVMLFILSGILLFLAMKVFPLFEAVYRHIAGTLSPWMAGLIAVTTVLSWVLFALCLIAGILSVVLYNKWRSSPDKSSLIAFFEKIPGVGDAIHETQQAKFTLALSTCIGAGMDDGMALEAASDILSRRTSREHAKAVADRVEDGANLVTAIREEDFYDMSDVRILTSGYRSGKLTEAFDHVAERQWEAAEADIGGLTDGVGPVIMMVLSVIIGLLLIAVMLPLISIMVSTM